MKREWNRNRQKQKFRILGVGNKNRYFPAIFCQREKFFIGFSTCSFIPSGGIMRFKVDKSQWSENFANWREKYYRIDFSKFEEGDLVMCPFCGGKVDFRMWISSVLPSFTRKQDDKGTEGI